MAAFAPACQQTLKPLIAPTTTSEDIARRYAVSSAGKETNKHAFFWPLTETDVRFSETLLSCYITNLGNNIELFHLQPNAALFSPNDLFGKTFTDWLPFHANNLGIVLTDNAQYANTDELLAAVTGYLDKQKEEGVAPITENSIASANFCVVESVQQMLSVARLRQGTNPHLCRV